MDRLREKLLEQVRAFAAGVDETLAEQPRRARNSLARQLGRELIKQLVKSGRPPDPLVTKAVAMYEAAARQWSHRIFRECVPGYSEMGPAQQRTKRIHLQAAVRQRMRTTEKRQDDCSIRDLPKAA